MYYLSDFLLTPDPEERNLLDILRVKPIPASYKEQCEKKKQFSGAVQQKISIRITDNIIL